MHKALCKELGVKPSRKKKLMRQGLELFTVLRE